MNLRHVIQRQWLTRTLSKENDVPKRIRFGSYQTRQSARMAETKLRYDETNEALERFERQ